MFRRLWHVFYFIYLAHDAAGSGGACDPLMRSSAHTHMHAYTFYIQPAVHAWRTGGALRCHVLACRAAAPLLLHARHGALKHLPRARVLARALAPVAGGEVGVAQAGAAAQVAQHRRPWPWQRVHLHTTQPRHGMASRGASRGRQPSLQGAPPLHHSAGSACMSPIID